MAYVPSGVCPCSYWNREVSFGRLPGKSYPTQNWTDNPDIMAVQRERILYHSPKAMLVVDTHKTSRIRSIKILPSVQSTAFFSIHSA
jgi:hypothetical protein